MTVRPLVCHPIPGLPSVQPGRRPRRLCSRAPIRDCGPHARGRGRGRGLSEGRLEGRGTHRRSRDRHAVRLRAADRRGHRQGSARRRGDPPRDDAHREDGAAGTSSARPDPGWICANAGIDESNAVRADSVTLASPRSPTTSAEQLRVRLIGATPAAYRSVSSCTDTFGRPWRDGLVDVALGVAGIGAILDYRGATDMGGRELHHTHAGARRRRSRQRRDS